MCKCTPNIRTPWCGKEGCKMSDDNSNVIPLPKPDVQIQRDECRKVFETKAVLYDLKIRADGHYEARDTECAWIGWKSAWEHFKQIKPR